MSPGDSHAQISFDGMQVSTDGFCQTSCRLQSILVVDGEYRGELQVYLEGSSEDVSSAGGEKFFATAARILEKGLEHRLTGKTLRSTEEELSALLGCIDAGVIVTDEEGRISRMNDHAEQLTGWRAQEGEGRLLESVLRIDSPEDDGGSGSWLDRLLQSSGTPEHPELGIVASRDGCRRLTTVSASLIGSGDDGIRRAVIVLSDESDQYLLSERLLVDQEYKQSIVELIPDVKVLQAFAEASDHSILRFSRKGTYLDVITSSEDRLYLPKHELVGKKVGEVLPKEEGKRFIDAIEASLDTGGLQTIEYTLPTPDNGLWFEAQILPVSDGDVLALIRDITERKRLEQQIHYLSFHDELTGLYNRAYAQQQIQADGAELRLPLSIIVADLNGLKFINDSLGHACGDRALQAAAETIRQSCRRQDLAARWGGDEFVILLPDTSQDDVVKILRRIEKAAGATQIGELGLPLSMALGWATRISPDEDIEMVIGEAENRMYRDKLSRGSSQDRILSGMMKTLRVKSHETEQHVRRMQTAAVRVARAIELDSSEIEKLKLAVALHDIGKISVPEKVLKKPAPLTDRECELVRSHCEIGYRIARKTEDFHEVAKDILHHHERWDGCGYPDGLQAEDIPLRSRIIAIADAYDVMTSGRPYRDALRQQEAVSELRRCAGTQFDPHLVEVFISLLPGE